MNPIVRSTRPFLLALLLMLSFASARAEVLALTGGTVHTVTGPVIPSGVVLVDGARITAVGAEVAVPAGARVIDCRGKHVYPGFVHANTVLGLQEISTIVGSDDTQETGNVNPNQRAEVMVNPESDFLPVARLNGITTALVIPGGGSIRGTSALMHLDGWTQEDMTVSAPVALHVQWPNMTPVKAWWDTRSEEEQNKARDTAVQAITDAFEDARAYDQARAAEGRPGVPSHDADARWDAMRRVVRGEIPVIFHADALDRDPRRAALLRSAEAQARDPAGR
jgi:imidazolonepropionase-like amidohydrolase